jgi:hypothetical protein
MSPNLTAYYWAEQTNRQRLADHARRAWRTEEATEVRSTRDRVASARSWAAVGLVQLTSRLQRMLVPGAVRPIAKQGGAPV